MCVGLTLGGDDLINIPACKANLLHSEGCSYHGATHEGDIADWAGGVEIFTPPNPTSTNTLHRHRRARHVQTHANEDYSTLQCTYMHANTVPVSVTCCKCREHVQCVAHRTNPGTWTGRTWSITLYIYFFSQIFQ